VSTGAEQIIQGMKAYEGARLIKRDSELPTIMEEYKRTLKKIIEDLGETPARVVMLLGNSPCVLSATIDSAVEALTLHPDSDSVVSVEKRHEFKPANAFNLNDNGFLEPLKIKQTKAFDCFIDSRIAVVRPENILKLAAPYKSVSAVYGKKIYPLLQEDGVMDIDYPWQAPIVERWLKNNGFSHSETPYKNTAPKTSGYIKDTGAPAGQTQKLRIFVSTVPFGEIDSYPVDIMKRDPNCEYVINPIGRKLKEHELADILKDFDILVAGTEPITAKVMDSAKRLKLISRVGIGLDNVDLAAAKARGIKVSYTPDAPAPAVAELAMGHILNACRMIATADRKLRDGVWQRLMGGRLSEKTVGIIGTGRIGTRMMRHLQGFAPKKILVNDLKPDAHLYELYHAEFADKETIYKEADIITFHVPMTRETCGMISKAQIELMKKDVVLINTSRGGIIDERDLFEALKAKKIGAAAIDVFKNEPYGGELVTLDNCYFTCHMGSCSTDCRFAMEKQATEEAMRFVRREKLELEVPEYEYQAQTL
jgi:D-3-phosphoglycerate dehydrogenase